MNYCMVFGSFAQLILTERLFKQFRLMGIPFKPQRNFVKISFMRIVIKNTEQNVSILCMYLSYTQNEKL